jgi:hypothetical protein
MSNSTESRSRRKEGGKNKVVPPLGAGTPNEARHRIAALLRFGMNVKGRVWAARGARGR